MVATRAGAREQAEAAGLEVAIVVAEPPPDIHQLFSHYNDLYFSGALGPCTVQWSLMTSTAGACRYLRGGACEVHLSEPLLKFRSTSDLKNTLLHEMIHAFLFTTKRKRDHCDHGPAFRSVVNAINSSSVIDCQRPFNGYNITIYHEFHDQAESADSHNVDHDEVDSHKVHHWICESCGDVIKRSRNKKPSGSDCIKHMGRHKSCGKLDCHWHEHKLSCGGKYTNKAEPTGNMDRKKVSKGAKKLLDEPSKLLLWPPKEAHGAMQSYQGSYKSDDKKEKSIIEKPSEITKNFHAVTNNGIFYISPASQNVVRSEKLEGTKLDAERSPVVADTLKQTAQSASEKREHSPRAKKRHAECFDEFTVASEWLDYYADEESDEFVKPLINKRAVRRTRQMMIKNAMARNPVIYHPSNTSSSGDWFSVYYSHSNSLQLACLPSGSPVKPTVHDNVIDISDDSS